MRRADAFDDLIFDILPTSLKLKVLTGQLPQGWKVQVNEEPLQTGLDARNIHDR
jgi:hypothetical protein